MAASLAISLMTAGDVLEKRYELRDEIGATPCARVFQGWDRELGKLVTVKVLEPPPQHDQWLEQLKLAIRNAQRLYHPAIVRIFDLRINQTSPYLVMEAIEGESLRQYLARRKRVHGRTFLSTADQLAEVLSVAHAKGIVHGDLRPDCIFVGSDGRLRVSDFALGTVWQQWNGALSVPVYAAPEVVRRARFSTRSDIYSLGCLLYELLGGNPRDLLDGSRRSLRGVPGHVNLLWQACTQQSVWARPRTADLVKLGLAGHTSVRGGRSTPVWWILAVIGALLIIGALWVTLTDSHRSRTPVGRENTLPGSQAAQSVETAPTPE